MSKRIFNTVRGSGENTKERAIQLTMRQCREHRQANRISYCITTRIPSSSEATREVAKSQIRTMLWP